jgi:energy-converting hydrogenase Eha subunit E
MKINKRLALFYTSMIIYIAGSIPLVLYTLVIYPIVKLYNEPISSMVSPVFGNYYDFLLSLFVVSLVFMLASIAFFLLSLFTKGSSGTRNGLRLRTILLPVLLYIFAFALIGVSYP